MSKDSIHAPRTSAKSPHGTLHVLTSLVWLLFLAACAAPQPAPLPAISPSPSPVVVPSLVPFVSPSPIPAVPPTPIPDQLTLDPALLPALERTIDLGSGTTDPWYLGHPIAIEAKADRVYVSVSAFKTLVLDGETLSVIGSLPIGGSIGLYPEHDRLYIGVPGNYGFGATTTNAAELKMFDASTLALRRTMTFSDTSNLAPYVVPDPITGKVYVVHAGVYVADADTLDVIDTLSGTLPMPGSFGYSLYAIDAAIDPVRRRLFVSLNNAVPGSNNGNVLNVYDLTTGEAINSDYEPSVINLAVDAQSGAAYVPRSNMGGSALVKYDAQGVVRRRLENLSGKVQIDPQHDRVYVFYSYPARLVVLDRELNYLGEVSLHDTPDVIDYAIDHARDRLYLLSSSGRLQVLSGHARTIADQPPLPAPPRVAAQWIVPSPNYAQDRLIFAAFGVDPYSAGLGTLFVNRDEGQTWEFVTGLPLTNTAAALAVSPDFAAAPTLFIGLSSYTGAGSGIYRSTDGGRSWQPSSRGLTDLAIIRVIVSPDFANDRTVFASGAKAGLFRSTDGGATWTPLADRYVESSEQGGYAMLSTFAVSPNFARDRSLLISRTAGTSGAWLSRDGGESWRKVLADSATHFAYLADGQTVYAALGGGSLPRSDDGGEHWVAASEGLDLTVGSYVGGLIARDSNVLTWMTLYDRPTRLYQRIMRDRPWVEVGGPSPLPGMPDQVIGDVFALANDGSLFTGTADGHLHRYYVDNLYMNPPAERRARDLAVQTVTIARDPGGNEVYLSGGQFGLWASRDLNNWFDVSFPDRNTLNPMQIVVSPDYAHDATLLATAGLGLYRSRGKPWEWQQLPIGTGSVPIGSVAISPNFAADRTLLAAGDYRQAALYRSSDGGDTWNTLKPPFPITQSLMMKVALTSDRDYWLWIDYSGLYHTTDGGATWTQTLTRSDAPAQVIASSPDFANDRTIWIGLLYDAILTTTDGGQTWASTARPGDVGMVLRSIALSPDFARDQTAFVGMNGGLYRTTDGGATWQAIATALPPTEGGYLSISSVAISPDFANDNTLMVVAQPKGVSISRDRGGTWVRVDQ